uniref:DUF4283 domain-containing protein n=1 Tax=Cannabis sativa TaxID=3483 RepID=A0A803QCA3_CANSA
MPNKSKSMDAVIGIEPIYFTDEESVNEGDGRETDVDLFQAPLSPKSSLSLIQRQEEIRSNFATFVEANAQCNNNISQGKTSIPPILGSGNIQRYLDNSFKNLEKEKVKITDEDIEEEVNFWNSTIVCYVLGTNPPLSVIDGFARRVWKDRIDKVGMISHGVFLIQFYTIEDRDNVLNGGYIFFNKFPLVMKPWNSDGNFKKENLNVILILVQLENLELKYWGERVNGHTPAVMTFHNMLPSGKKPFRYFKMLNTHPDYAARVAASWNQQTQGLKMFQVATKLKRLKGVLKELNKHGFSDIRKATQQAKETLAKMQNKLQQDLLN